MTSANYFDAAKNTFESGELASEYNEKSALANSPLPELLAAQEKSDLIKEQQQDFGKVLDGVIDASQSSHHVAAVAETIISDSLTGSKKGVKKDDLTFILTLQALNQRIADLDAGYQAFQNIFDEYTHEEIAAGAHLNESGKFKDPKAEDYWQKYCELHGLNPNDQDLRKDPDRLKAVQDWIQEERREARASLDGHLDNRQSATASHFQTKQNSDRSHETSFEVAKAEEDTTGLNTEEQELENFALIRSECIMAGYTEEDTVQAEKDQFEKLSEGAKEILKSDPDKQYLFEDENAQTSHDSGRIEQPTITQGFTP